MRRISVIGFGKIGQAVAANILQQDIFVIAIDTNPELQKVFKEGSFYTNEPGVNEILTSAYREDKLIISDKFSLVKDSDAVIVAIPLLVDHEKKIMRAPFLGTVRRLGRAVQPFCAV